MCNFEQCPACETPQLTEECVVGVSGDYVFYRCRACGSVWNAVADLRDALGSCPGDPLLDEYA